MNLDHSVWTVSEYGKAKVATFIWISDACAFVRSIYPSGPVIIKTGRKTIFDGRKEEFGGAPGDHFANVAFDHKLIERAYPSNEGVQS